MKKDSLKKVDTTLWEMSSLTKSQGMKIHKLLSNIEVDKAIEKINPDFSFRYEENFDELSLTAQSEIHSYGNVQKYHVYVKNKIAFHFQGDDEFTGIKTFPIKGTVTKVYGNYSVWKSREGSFINKHKLSDIKKFADEISDGVCHCLYHAYGVHILLPTDSEILEYLKAGRVLPIDDMPPYLKEIF